MIRFVKLLSMQHEVPLQKWIAEGAVFKFVGDNVDKRKGVRDIRSDHRQELKHMYSLLIVKGRVKPPLSACTPFLSPSLKSTPITTFLPSLEDIAALKSNMVVLVSRIISKYIKGLSHLSKYTTQHITHVYSQEMATKSEVVVLDVLHKNEAKHSDMLEIMKAQQSYLGPEFNSTVLSGGDQLTCERQRCSQKHVMDSDNPKDRLELLEPQVEDWHALQSILGVSQ